jgi:hypothetical protein
VEGATRSSFARPDVRRVNVRRHEQSVFPIAVGCANVHQVGGLRSRIASSARSLPVLRRYPAAYVTAGIDGWRLRRQFDAVRTFVLFVGQPRTGHSLVGALLDAHPNALVAHELDALKYVAAGYDRRRLFALLVRQERKRVAGGHVSSSEYTYGVPGQWQGRFQRLEVIGDKKGGRSTIRLGSDIGLLDRLADAVEVDVRVIRVVRNPYDVIATMHRRAPNRPFPDVIELFFSLEATVEQVRQRLDQREFHEMRLEDLVSNPFGELSGLCRFLELPAPADYLEACSRIVFDAPRRTRDDAPWTPELLDRIAARSSEHPAVARYGFGTPAAEEWTG